MQIIDSNLRFKSGVYEIYNKINKKKYIGSSKNLYNRLHGHISCLKANKHHNKHLQNAWNKYGEKEFEYNILKFCLEINRFVREQHYINIIKPEYNKVQDVFFFLKGHVHKPHKLSEEQKKKISETLKRKYASGEIITYKQQHN